MGLRPPRVSTTRCVALAGNETAIDHVLRETPDTVPAHLGERAVRVDVVHIEVRFGRRRRPDLDDAIGAYSEMAVAEPLHGLGAELQG